MSWMTDNLAEWATPPREELTQSGSSLNQNDNFIMYVHCLVYNEYVQAKTGDSRLMKK
jgi:hypothetical protein